MAERRAPKHKRQSLPAVCLDEHIPPRVTEAFKVTFRVIETSHNLKYKGRDEWAYVNDLYRENALFVTSDFEHARHIARGRWQHAGVVYIPGSWGVTDKVLYSQIVTGFVQEWCRRSRFALRNHLVYPADEGLHLVRAAKDWLHLSWTRLGHLVNESPTALARRTRKKRRA